MDITFENDDSRPVVEVTPGYSVEKGKRSETDAFQIERPHENRKPVSMKPKKRKKVSWPDLEAPPSQQNSRDVFETLNTFANPDKKLATSKPHPSESESEDQDVDDIDLQRDEMESEEEEEMDEDADYITTDSPRHYQPQHPDTPGPGYTSIDDERSDILCKLERMRKRGFKNLRQFGLNSNLSEMRAELQRVTKEIELEASIKFQRKMLIALVSGIELANKKFNPLDLYLDGFSEHTMENINDFTSIFEQLFFKYRSSVSTPPEIQLLLTLGGSAFMFHLSNTFFKQGGAASVMQNQEMMKQMAKAMQQQQQQNQEQQNQNQSQEDPPRREIRGPDFDLFGGGKPSMPPPVVPPFNYPVSTRQPSTVITEADVPEKEDNEAEDRLSDIISDLDSVPDDLSLSGGDDRKPVDEEKTVNVPSVVKKKGRKKTDPAKNVMVL